MNGCPFTNTSCCQVMGCQITNRVHIILVASLTLAECIPSKLIVNIRFSLFFNIKVVHFWGVLRRFQHGTGHITTGSWKDREKQYIQFVRVLYCKLPTNGKQLPAFPLVVVPETEPWPQRWEARVLPLCHRGPYKNCTRHLSLSNWLQGVGFFN